jgi:hypothetical protein
MNIGVKTGPCGVRIRPVRARVPGAVAVTSNETGETAEGAITP